MAGAPTEKPEPSEGGNNFVSPVPIKDVSPGEGDYTPGILIPSTGRGNYEDGSAWANPSANQLFRALKRKNKPIPADHAMSVGMVHAAVTDMSWNAVLEYEKFHKCENPKLARFYGMYGIHTAKTKMLKAFSGIVPFDRHDWIVDRCGKEVRYIIDYYSIEQPDPLDPHGEPDMVYSVDARPALTFGGAVDRVRMGVTKWWKGEDWF